MLYLKNGGQPIKLVVFDNDGVLLDLKSRFAEHCRFAAEYAGFSLDILEEWLADIYEGRRKILATIREGTKDTWPDATDEQIDKYIEGARAWERDERNYYPVIPGAVEVIRWLKTKGVPVAICTTNTYAGLCQRLQRAGLEIKLFDAFSTLDWEYPKPHPRAFDPIIEKTDTGVKEAIYMGDVLADYVAAKGAGIEFIACLSGGTPKSIFREAGVQETHIISSVVELPKLVLEK